jgi:hypothetical protein
MKLRLEDIYGAPGFIVEGIPFGNLCDYLSELEGVVFTFRRRLFLSSRDIRAEFTFGSNTIEIRPDPEDNRLWLRPKSGSVDFAELRKVRDFIKGLALRESRRVGKSEWTSCIVSASAALIVLLGGWLFPIYYLSHDPDLRLTPDPDFRAGAVFPFAILLCLMFASHACRAYVRARSVGSLGGTFP